MIKSPISVISSTTGTTADVKPATTPAVAADKALVVAISPNNSVTATVAGVSTYAAQTDGSQRTKITDGSTNAAVKAASTAPVAADPALVVSVSPNSPQTLVDNAAFTDGTSRVTPAGFIFDETAGTALTENDVAAARVDSKRAMVGVIEDATSRGIRATVKAPLIAPTVSDAALVVALSPNGNQATESTLTTLNDKFTDGQTTQARSIGVTIGLNKTFTAVSDMFTPQQNADDVFSIRPGGRNVYVTRLWISAVNDTNEECMRVEVIRRSTADDPGTQMIVTPHFEGDVTSVSDVYFYTNNLGIGTQLGKLWGGYVTLPHKTTPKIPTTQPTYIWEWEAPSTKKPILLRRGTEDTLAINFCLENPADILMYVGVEWYEE